MAAGLTGMAGTETPVVLTLDAAKVRYSLLGIGGNYCFFEAGDPVAAYTLETLRPAYARTEMKCNLWAREGDPLRKFDWTEPYPRPQGAIDWSARRVNDAPGSRLRAEFEMMRTLSQRKIPFIISIWDLPTWMYAQRPTGKTNGEVRQQKRDLAPDIWPDMLDCIASYLLYAKAQYGAEPDLFSFNEPHANTGIPAEQYHEAVKRIGARLAAEKLKTKILLGDVYTGAASGGMLKYLEPVLQDAGAMKWVGAVSFHSWWNPSAKDYRDWADLADRLRLPLIVGEAGVDAEAWRNKNYRPFSYALREMTHYQDLLLHARPKTILRWEFTSDYSLLDRDPDTGAIQETERFCFQKHWCWFIPPGSEALAVSGGGDVIRFTAFRVAREDGGMNYAMHVSNDGKTPRPIRLSGLPRDIAELHVVRTASNELFRALAPVKPVNGVVEMSMPAESLTTLTTMPGMAGSGEVATHEMARAGQWVAGRFEGDEPFFSFTYAGRPSAGLLKTWKQDRTRKPLDDKRTQHTLTYTDPETGLVLRCVGIEYADFPTVEWTLYFRNGGDKATPILADIRPLDIRLEGASPTNRPNAGTDFCLHHHVGSPDKPEDYRPLETVLKPGVTKRIAAAGGRPSNSDLPYFNLEMPGGNGLIVVVGWPGQWAAEFACDKDKRLNIRAGQELTRLSLLPGEEIRTPLMALQFWDGDRVRSQNIWRRWMLAHNVPRPGGQLPRLFLSASSSYYFAVMARADTASQKLFFDRYREEGMPLDYWWMDAGWYPCDGDWWNTGSWEVDTNRFPKGLREVSDYVGSKGSKTIVWFEPERVRVGPLKTEHAGWLLHAGKDAKDSLLNLGQPEAWTWLVNRVDKLIVEQGIGLYRQDFNIDPLAFWRANDAPDRQGITEIRYVVGYLAYWDELRRRHPDMLIDTCSSGGRRNDLETLRRSVPLLRSDYGVPGVAQQCQTYGLASWAPYFGASMQDSRRNAWARDWGSGGDMRVWESVYLMRSHLTPLPTLRFDMREKSRDYTLARRVVDQWRQFGRLYLGDYYPLTPYSLDEKVWMAWQFDCPESGEGLVQAFRRKENTAKSVQLKLRRLVEQAVYTVTNVDIPGSVEMTGRDLMDIGLAVVIAEQPGAAFITYKKK